MTIIVFCTVAGLGAGMAGLAYAWIGPPRRQQPDASGRLARRGLRRDQLLEPVGLGLVAGVAVALVTRWPVAGVAGAVGVASALRAWRQRRAVSSLSRLEAIAVWTELVRDALGASAGLAGALVATAPMAPQAIAEQVMRLADRLVNGASLEESLRALADELGDPAADLVVCALLLAASSRAQRLGELLGALADSIREEVALRLRVDAGRASARSGVRTIVGFSLCFAGGLLVVGRSYLAPFGTLTGQVVLAAVVALYVLGIVTMLRMVQEPRPDRLLSSGAGAGAGARAGAARR